MTLHDTICEACGIKFAQTEENQKYCDPKCRKDKINTNFKPQIEVFAGEREFK